MTWVRIDENFPEHPKIMAAGDDAAWWFVCALAYSNRHLTDGFIPASTVKRLTNHKRPIILAVKLVEVGLLDQTEGGFQIHDFLHYQPSKATVEEERRKARERMAKARGSSPDVRPNNTPNLDRSSDNPSPSRPVPSELLKSSVGSSNVRSIRDDDDGFTRAIDIIVEAKARKHPPNGTRSIWEKTVRPNTISEVGDQVKVGIAAGSSPIDVAGNILGSRAEAELAASRLA